MTSRPIRTAEKVDAIRLRGVKTHNLAGIDVDIPRGKFVAVTGVSGSGKSSLAFDTLYAEGQRRYLECCPASARPFLPKLERAAVDTVENVPPALAVSQSAGFRSRGATVAAATGLLPYLRALFASVCETVCPRCHGTVTPATAEDVIRELRVLAPKDAVLIAWPLRVGAENRETFGQGLMEAGFVRVEIDGSIVRLDAPDFPAPTNGEILRVIVDRIDVAGASDERLTDSIDAAFERGEGEAGFRVGNEWMTRYRQRRCSSCGDLFDDPEPSLFDWMNPLAACAACGGTGAEKSKSRADAKSSPLTAACFKCHGSRFNERIRNYRWDGVDFAELLAMRVDQASALLRNAPSALAIKPLLDQIRQRIGFLVGVGLEYVTLGRSVDSLSLGEARRVALTNVLGSDFTHALIVLDEPTAGLHAGDVARLLGSIHSLRGRRNTVVVVEHDRDVIVGADHVIDLGPGAGSRGGRVIFEGTPSKLAGCDESLTAASLHVEDFRERPYVKPSAWLKLEGVRTNNLKIDAVDIPLGSVCVVAGVSGAGKSSLVVETLYPAVARELGDASAAGGRCDHIGGVRRLDRIAGVRRLDDVALVEAASIGRSSRSNPATYLKFFDEIRRSFADTTEARIRGLDAGSFSFNRPGGRCERCEGDGELTVEMHFLPPVRVVCPECGGNRFQPNVLEVKYRGRNIAEVLSLSVVDAFEFFRGEARVQLKLQPLIEVGLGYLPLGQSLATFSGGEAQRIKLATFLAGRRGNRALILLEEPTTGLHPADVATLLEVLRSLVAAGHSIVVVEHNADVLRGADYVIELGPGAAEEGGRVIAFGTPAKIATGDTPTAKVLRGERFD